MKKRFIRWKQSTQISNNYLEILIFFSLKTSSKRQCSEAGLTIIELLIAMFISSIVIGLALFGSVLNRRVFVQSKARTDISQTLRLPLDSIGNDIKQAGEGIGTTDPNFPVILLEENPTKLVIRRQLVPTSIPVCQDIIAGTSDPVVVMDQNGGSPLVGCEVGSLLDNNGDGWPDAWDSLKRLRDYRLTNGSTIRAFIYNGNGDGEFFDYENEAFFDENDVAIATVSASGTPVEYATLNTNKSNWTNNYLADSSSRIYLLEERRYQLDETTNVLQLITDDDETLNMTNNIGVLDIEIILEQDDIEYTCSVVPPTITADCNTLPLNAYSWSQIKAIDVMMQVDSEAPQASILNSDCDDLNNCPSLQLKRRFVPRNVFNF
ncbi:MAG: hypothetical protein HC799_08235 [Limnothrix sp. RL_2_0]|nr:hypothetical protein [Limnothrix sp. RL_2_0]